MTDVAGQLPPALARFVGTALRIKNFIICVFALIMGVTFFAVVVLRYGLHADLFAYEEWLLIICFWLYFLASAVGTHEKVHINADLLSYVLTDPKAAWRRNLLVHAIELVVTSVLIYWSVQMILDELSFYPYLQSTNALRIPLVVPRAAMLVGFGFMAFYSILHIYVDLKTGPAPASDSAPEGRA